MRLLQTRKAKAGKAAVRILPVLLEWTGWLAREAKKRWLERLAAHHVSHAILLLRRVLPAAQVLRFWRAVVKRDIDRE